MGEAKDEKQAARKAKGENAVGGRPEAARTAGGAASAKEKKRSLSEPSGQKDAAKTLVAKVRGIQTGSREVPEGLPKKYSIKSTFNTHDIMHSPVEKTLKMLDKILSGERLFTM